MINRRTLALLFVGLWLFMMFTFFYRSQPGDSPEMQELSRQLRRALDNNENLSKKNKQLKDEAASLRSVYLIYNVTHSMIILQKNLIIGLVWMSFSVVPHIGLRLTLNYGTKVPHCGARKFFRESFR